MRNELQAASASFKGVLAASMAGMGRSGGPAPPFLPLEVGCMFDELGVPRGRGGEKKIEEC